MSVTAAASPVNSKPIEELRTQFAALGQDHVFAFWDDLDATGREALLRQTSEIGPQLEDLCRAYGSARDALRPDRADSSASPSPAPVVRLPEHGGDAALWARARERGEALLREGRVAAFVVAGGQGTRLGHPGPKGGFALGPVSDRTLFEIQAQKLRGLARRYGRPLPWYVMTSPATDAETREHLERNDYFGLDPADVSIIRQEMAPALDYDGRLILERPDRIFESPSGHGGAFAALLHSGALADMERRGIDTIFYYQVDNPLIRIGDPSFLGLHAESDAEMSAKVLRKPDPDVKWGVAVVQEGRSAIVEYTELTAELRNARDSDGELVYWAGSPAIHVLSRDFCERIAARSHELLPLHLSEKKIPNVDAAGRATMPTEPNGYKLERFVFDALPLATRVCFAEARASEEFSPVKNAEGLESPSSARADLVAEYRRWLDCAGIPLPPEDTLIEIDHAYIDGPDDARAHGLKQLADAGDSIRTKLGTQS